MNRTRLAAASVAAAALAVGLPNLAVRASETIRVASLDTSRMPALGAVRPGEIVVGIRSDAPVEADARVVRAARGLSARRSPFARRYVVELEPGVSLQEALRRLETDPDVAYAETNGVVRAFFRPNDRLYFAQWHLQALRAERTWDIQRGAETLGVAILDSGIAYEDFGAFRKAPDFGTTEFLPGLNVFNGSSHANDDNFHGTHVASIVAQSTNNSDGAAGLAFDVSLMPVKVLDAEGVGSFFAVADGIDYVVRYNQQNPSRPVRVINMSLGGDGDSQAVRRAIDSARAAGITVVAASGNDDARVVSFPAAIPGVIAVGAVDGRKAKAPYSNFGSALDLVAYGGDIDRDDTGENGRPDGRPDGILQQTFDPDAAARGNFTDFGHFFVVGTSQSSPQVAALAALVIQQGITDPDAVQHWLERTAEDLGDNGRDDRFGHGLIQPVEALRGLGVGIR
jgi:serine protease